MIETNFKHTDIGVIPHDWEVKNINYLFNFKQGVQCPIHLQSLQNTAGKIRFIRIIDLTQPNEPPRYILDPGAAHHITEQDLFMVRYGSPGLIGYGYTGVVANNLFQLIPRITISTHFYKYILTEYHKEILALCSSSTMPAVNFTALSSLQIPLPPTLAEQEKIANALSKIDQLINDLGALIEKKKAIKQGTMQDLLTAKRRLKGFTGEWNSVKLGDMCYFGKGKGLKKEYLTDNGRYKCILYGEIFTKYDSIIKSVVSRTNIEEGTYSQKGDVLMPGSTTTLGIDLVKAVVINENDVLLGGDVIILRPKENQISSEFLAYLISNIDRNKVADVTQGITIIHLHAKNMTDIAYLIPPTLAEQNAIANVLSSMDTEITNLEQKRDKYIAIKQGMMQNLLTGKIRLI